MDLESQSTISAAHCLLNFYPMPGTSSSVFGSSQRGMEWGDEFSPLYYRPLHSFVTSRAQAHQWCPLSVVLGDFWHLVIAPGEEPPRPVREELVGLWKKLRRANIGSQVFI